MFGGCSEVSCFDDLQRHDMHNGRWAEQSTRGKAPTRRKGHSLTLLGPAWAQQLFVFGGWGGDGPVTNSLKAFALATASWEVLSIAGTPPPARWAHTATAIDSSRMVVIGGEGVLPGQYFNDVHLFDLDQQQWTRMHPQGDGSTGRVLPAARMGHSATLIGEAILCFGGYVNELRGNRRHRVASNELWALDLKGGATGKSTPGSPTAEGMRWVQVPTIGQAPAARGFHMAVAAGTNLFVGFGCDEVESACFNDMYMLDTSCESSFASTAAVAAQQSGPHFACCPRRRPLTRPCALPFYCLVRLSFPPSLSLRRWPRHALVASARRPAAAVATPPANGVDTRIAPDHFGWLHPCRRRRLGWRALLL